MGNEKTELLTNENLRQILLNKENIAPLEELLAREISKLKRLRKLADQDKLNFGPTPSEDQLEGILAEVKEKVDSFLGVNNVDAPNVLHNGFMRFSINHLGLLFNYGVGAAALGYGLPKGLGGSWVGWLFAFVGSSILIRAALDHLKMSKRSFYTELSETITLARIRRAPTITTVGHEYAHHIQKIRGLNSAECSIINEGHAIGVANHIALHYREKEDNEAFLFRTTNGNVRQLKEAYRWICKEQHLNPKKSLGVTGPIRDPLEDYINVAVFGSTAHALGRAVVYLCESVRGPQVYREILNGKFQFAAAK